MTSSVSYYDRIWSTHMCLQNEMHGYLLCLLISSPCLMFDNNIVWLKFIHFKTGGGGAGRKGEY